MPTERRLRRGIFLDRDGVINKEKHHVHRVEDSEFIDDVFDLCRWFEARGYTPDVVTNQAGIGRGSSTEEDFSAVTAWMIDQLRAAGVSIAAVYHCSFYPE